MKRFGLAVLLALALPARGDVTQLPQPAINALTLIDEVPSTAQLNGAFDNQALANLEMIALDQGSFDLGVHLRAVRALTHYCNPAPCTSSDPVHATIMSVLATPRYANALNGSDLLVLRAAIEALGVLRVAGDWSTVASHLQHPSRDIRAAAAHALRDLGDNAAVPALRARYQQEQVPQVRIAISDALRVLGQPVP